MRLFFAISALALICGTYHLDADVLGVDLATTTPTDFGASLWSLGWEFQANTTVTVDGLGNWDTGSPSNLSGPQQVGLWDSSGNLLASAFVTDSSTQIGSFWAFTMITPVTLTAGDFYVVGAEGGADYTGIVPITVAPQITYVQDMFTFNNGVNSPLVEPQFSEGLTTTAAAGLFGGNILISTVPEPGYYLPLCATLILLVGSYSLRGRLNQKLHPPSKAIDQV
jgi:Domain of unknown function (DUF4082)